MSEKLIHHIEGVAVRCDLLFPHPTEAKILVASAGHGFSLPFVEPAEHHTAVVGHIQRHLRDKYGLDAVAVRLLVYANAPAEKAQYRLYLLDNWQGMAAAPAGFCWLDESEMAAIELSHPEHEGPLRQWYAEQHGRLAIPSERVPWARPGWYNQIRTWIGTELARTGYQLISIELHRAWGISAGLWVETDQGTVYVKACPTQFRREPGVTAFLAQQAPDHFPNLIALDSAQGWLMMLVEVSDGLLGQPALSHWQTAVTEYARLQKASRHSRRQLAALGCGDRTLLQLIASGERLLADEAVLRPEPEAALSDDEWQRFREVWPLLRVRCLHFGEKGIKPALVHGDFHPGNVLWREKGPVFIDWSDACWAHPFVDIVVFLLEDFGNPPAIKANQDAVINAYLDVWTDEKPFAELRAEYEALLPVGILFYALSFAELVKNLEPSARWEMHNTIPFFVRQLLAVLDQE